MSGTPQRRSRHPKRAPSPHTRRSHHAASSNPPATHQPSMAAMTGFDSGSRVGPSGPLSRGGGAGRAGWRRRENAGVVAGEHGDPADGVGVEGEELVVEPLRRWRC